MKLIMHRRIITPVMVFLLLLGAGCGTQPVKDKQQVAAQQLYRCPMHHDIVRDKPGSCPICGMDLVAFNSKEGALTDVNLNTLLRPANSYVISSIPVVLLHNETDTMEVKTLGTIQYDTRAVGTVSARVSGRIEKLYLKYTFQDVRKGQKLMDIYSPELMTAQQNLLFLLQNDAGNASFIQSAREKLLLRGMSSVQLQDVIRSRQPTRTVTIYSPLDGHIHDALNMEAAMPASSQEPLVTRDLMLKEGMYVQKGQAVLTVMNARRLWVVLNIYGDDQGLVKTGDPVHIVSEAMPDMNFNAKIDFIEPFYREGSKTLAARVYFENRSMMMPVGSQVRASISVKPLKSDWLPEDAVISLGINSVVFKKTGPAFKAYKVETGRRSGNNIQITGGLGPRDTVAANAQFLIDSESFIKVNE